MLTLWSIIIVVECVLNFVHLWLWLIIAFENDYLRSFSTTIFHSSHSSESNRALPIQCNFSRHLHLTDLWRHDGTSIGNKTFCFFSETIYRSLLLIGWRQMNGEGVKWMGRRMGKRAGEADENSAWSSIVSRGLATSSTAGQTRTCKHTHMMAATQLTSCVKQTTQLFVWQVVVLVNAN